MSNHFSLSVLLFTVSFLSITLEAQQTTNACFHVEGTSEYFFGQIEQNATVEHMFRFTNSCSDTVEVASVRAGCGCTAAVISERVIPPGGDAKINVKFTPPRSSHGRVTKTVSVYLKGESEAHTILRISSEVISDIEIDPSYIQLTNATVGEKITATSRITNTSEKDIVVSTTGVNLTSYRDTDGSGNAVAYPMKGGAVSPLELQLAPGESGVFTIQIIPEYPGQFNGSLGLNVGSNASVIYLFGIVKNATTKDKR